MESSRPSSQPRAGSKSVSPIVEVSKAGLVPLPSRGADAPQMLRLAPLPPDGPASMTADLKPWDSFLVRMILGWFVVLVPFFVLAALFNMPQQGLWPDVGALLLLAALLALSTWWGTRPVLALSRVAAAIESAGLPCRAVPPRRGRTQRLALAVNRLLERIVTELPRLRGPASESTRRLSGSVELLGTAAPEQAQAATGTSAAHQALATA